MNARMRAIARENRRKDRDLADYRRIADYIDFNNVFSLDCLDDAAKSCAKDCRWKAKVIDFMAFRTANCIKLAEKLKSGKYYPNKITKFYHMERGKKRLITAVNFTDRVVQKALCDNFLMPIFSNMLVYDNSASIKYKGVSFARNRVTEHLSKAKKYDELCVVVSDFHNYFGSISSVDAYNLFLFKMAHILNRAKPYISNDEFTKKVENLKKIFTIFEKIIKKEPVLSLGSQVSQIAALYYLNRLDHEAGKYGYYARYMDDAYCLCENYQKALEYRDFLREQAKMSKLELNLKKTRIIRLYKGEKMPFLKRNYSISKDGRIHVSPNHKAYRYTINHIKRVIKVSDGSKIPSKTLYSMIGNAVNLYSDCDLKHKPEYIVNVLAKTMEKQGFYLSTNVDKWGLKCLQNKTRGKQ